MSSLIDRYNDPFAPRERCGVCSNTGSSSTTSGTSKAAIPAGLQPLISQSANTEGALGTAATPGLFSQLQSNPEAIAGLTPQESNLINSLAQQGGVNGTNPLISSAEGSLNNANSQLSELTSGPIGSSPATIAAMNAYNTNQVPQVMQALALGGAGRGGGATEALTSSREAAYTPLVQQEIANREAAPAQYGALAGEAGNLATTQAGLTQAGLNAAQLKQQTAQAKNEAAYQDLLRQYGLEQTATLGPIQQVLGSLIGQNQQSTTTTNPSIWSLF